MIFKLVIKLLVLFLCSSTSISQGNNGFIYNGFQRANNLSLDGIAEITPNGLLMLTNDTKQKTGHAFYPNPIKFKNTQDGSSSSFSTSFVFGIISEYPTLSGHGIAFVIAPTRGLPGASASQYLGLFNISNDGNATNFVVAVELDTIENTELGDINNNHVGIDINSLRSNLSEPAGYYQGHDQIQNLTLFSGLPMRIWVEYNGVAKQMNVTLAPLNLEKPKTPLLSMWIDISPFINQSMYVGFSSSTGSVFTRHYVVGWSFMLNGEAEELDLSELPKLPRVVPKKKSRFLTMGVPVLILSLLVLTLLGVGYYVRRKRKFAEIVEDWEHDFATQRFHFKELYVATQGFKEKELLGTGGFGRVYRGVLPSSKMEIAVKRVSHESRQGMREFVAEIVSLGRLRHRNLVPLLGYCRRKNELLLVYEYMQNGSLDKLLYDQNASFLLSWNQRFRIIKGVASGLYYLHEEWEQVVVHRDVKASNVLLDSEMNGRLGDFGLARLYDHGTDPQTTHVVGTLGYLAPEHTRTGRATTSSDVYSFGAFLLEVVCGRRPIDPQATSESLILVDVVYNWWKKGNILKVVDQKLGNEYVWQQAEMVLKLGLLCSNSEAIARPSMRQVLLYLEGAVALPDLSSLGISANGVTFASRDGFEDFAFSHSLSSSSAAESSIFGGR
ncbi:hypothetical protein LIER_42186 [Lithospermum erythrorhizon]|uniref:non-specific serine/threonine protein kinase n=1 Tax=Lithospermum erythrorhizon TaxID=34254 RepID=A0AAV3RMH5_LITER